MGSSFSAPVQTVPGAHPSYTVDTGLFLGLKRPRHGVNFPTPSSVEVKERVELPLLPFWAFMVCFRANFTFTFYLPFTHTVCVRLIWSMCNNYEDNIFFAVRDGYFNISLTTLISGPGVA